MIKYNFHETKNVSNNNMGQFTYNQTSVNNQDENDYFFS